MKYPYSFATWAMVALGAISLSAQAELIDHSRNHQNIQKNSLQSSHQAQSTQYQVGPRPLYLVDDMDESPLKRSLQACEGQPIKRTAFSIGHRGAAMQFPEHTKESYMAAARMGAGIIECDVAFTKDHELVCRHAQNDLHTTTNILATPLAKKCTVPPKFDAQGKLTNAKDIECRTSDITLKEFKTLKGKMDAANTEATSIEEYMNATPKWRTDLYTQTGTLMSHKDSIELFKKLGVKMTPELKVPAVSMPDNGFTQNDLRNKMLDEYIQAGVNPNDVYPQTFSFDDAKYWVKHYPQFANNIVFLTEGDEEGFDIQNPKTWAISMKQIKDNNIKILSPALWMMVTTKNGKLVPSEYAKQAKANGLKLIGWSLERSGPLANGGGWYYTGLEDVTNNDGDMMNLLDFLAQDVGVIGVFSDWPATTTYYANCKGLVY